MSRKDIWKIDYEIPVDFMEKFLNIPLRTIWKEADIERRIRYTKTIIETEQINKERLSWIV